MLFNVHVVTRAEYDAHIAELKAKGQSRQAADGPHRHHGKRRG